MMIFVLLGTLSGESNAQGKKPDFIPAVNVLRGNFEQTRYLKGFQKPLKSEGRFLVSKANGVVWQGIKPFPTFVVSCHCGDYAERIDVAYLVDVNGSVNTAAHLFIGCDDIGDLQPGKVERLTRRNASDGILQKAFGQGGKGCVVISFVSQFTMNLIRHDKHLIP